jgi:outer membrane protein
MKLRFVVATLGPLAATLVGRGVATVPLRAQSVQPEPPSLRLTIADAVSRGVETSHRVAEAIARGQAADAIAGIRRAATLPQVAAEAGYTRTNHVDEFGVPFSTSQLRVIYPDIPDNYHTRLDVQWPLYTGGRLDALERVARIEATASADEVAVARADLSLEVTRAYWNLVTSIESLRVVEQAVARIDVQLRDVRNQLSAGLIPPNDVLTVEAQQSRQRMLAIQARAIVAVAEAELARLVGAAPGTRIEPAVAIDVPAAESAPIETLVDTARRQRPERAILLKRVSAANERTAAAGAGAKPVVTVAGGVDYARPNPRIFPLEASWRRSWDASVYVNWPLFDGGRTGSEIGEAKATARAMQERLADFDASLAVELRQRLNEVSSSRAAIDAATDAVRSATEARRVLVDRFAAGVATSADVLDAQLALLQAELDRTQAIANARLADAQLARALGR